MYQVEADYFLASNAQMAAFQIFFVSTFFFFLNTLTQHQVQKYAKNDFWLLCCWH